MQVAPVQSLGWMPGFLTTFLASPGLHGDYQDSHKITIQIIVIPRHDIKVEKPSTQKLGTIRINIASVL